jgi:photosystem II stability/assembly factor-like uncharacterized protein
MRFPLILGALVLELVLDFALPLVLCAQAPQKEDPQKIDKVCSQEDIDALGLSCSEDEPCPVFLELSAAEGFGANVFVTGNLHTVDTTISGVLLSSGDGGKTWNEPVQRIRAAELDQIQFADPQHGWAVGVKVDPLPRDPFLLVTVTGGEMWHPVPLFDEPLHGSIQQFWFESPNRGELVVDRSQGQTKRYELYASTTGGETWMLKESSDRPMQLPNDRPENGNWRTAADKDSYRVERRTATGWETLARFPIHAGDCK